MHIRPYLPRYPFADEELSEEIDQPETLSRSAHQPGRILFGFRAIVLLRLFLLSALLAAISHFNVLMYFAGNRIAQGRPLLFLLQSVVLLTIIYFVCRGSKAAPILGHRIHPPNAAVSGTPIFALRCFILLLGMQILMAAVMRGASAQYAVTDFPTIAGQWFPSFSADLLTALNGARSEQGFPDVSGIQVLLHVAHRVGAMLLILSAVVLTFERSGAATAEMSGRIALLMLFILLAFILGVCAVLYAPAATSALGLVHSIIAFLLFALALQTSFDFPSTSARVFMKPLLAAKAQPQIQFLSPDQP